MVKRFFQVNLNHGFLIFLDKEYLMNVINTLDNGLIVRTVKKLIREKEVSSFLNDLFYRKRKEKNAL